MSIAMFNLPSQYLRCNTEITVILPDRPPRMEAADFYASGEKYKVLWLLHGGAGDNTDWIRKSNIELYAVENNMIAVMPCAYNSSYANWTGYAGGLLMTDFFFRELMPFVYNWLPASDKREDNFIAGLSMGGQGVLKYTLMHPECFAGAAMLSSRAEAFPEYYELQRRKPGSVTENLVRDHGGIEAFMASEDNIRRVMKEYVSQGRLEELPLIYHAIGTEDSHYEEYLQFRQFCQAIGFNRLTFHETAGYAHEWRFWDLAVRDALRSFGLKCRDAG